MAMTSRIPTGRLALLDAIRGFAALWVAVYHFYIAIAADTSTQIWIEPCHTFCRYGHLGVPIFFVLSGFVMSYSLSRITINAPNVGRFIGRRSLRLDPTYWVVIWSAVLFQFAKSIVSVGHNQSVPSLGAVFANMFYLDGLLSVKSIIPVGWTLCLEVQFYLVFIIVLWLSRQLTRSGNQVLPQVLFALLSLWSIGVSSDFFHQPLPGIFVPYWCMFHLGVLAFWSVDRNWGVALLSLLALGVVIAQVKDGSAAVMTAAILSVAGRISLLNLPLGGAPFQYLGRVSYSFYLIHPSVGIRGIRAICTWVGGPIDGILGIGVFAGALLVSLLASELLYRFIEVPSHNLARRWFPMQRNHQITEGKHQHEPSLQSS